MTVFIVETIVLRDAQVEILVPDALHRRVHLATKGSCQDANAENSSKSERWSINGDAIPVSEFRKISSRRIETSCP